jgi:hypothetical protein
MEDLTIELKDGYNVLKDIYYRNGQGSVFTFRGTKRPIIFSSIFIALSVTFYFIALLYPDIWWIVLMVLCSLISFTGLIFSVVQGKRYFSWKNSTKKYLDEVRKYEAYSLTLTANTFILANSDETTIEKWESIQFVSINPDYISVKSDNHYYILPEKSMTPVQYIEVQNFIKKRMNGDSSKVLQSAKE